MTNAPIQRTWSETLAWCVNNTATHRTAVAEAKTEYSPRPNGNSNPMMPALRRARQAMRKGIGARTNGIRRIHGTPRTTRYEEVNASVSNINWARAYPVSVR